jgi:PilZ domain
VRTAAGRTPLPAARTTALHPNFNAVMMIPLRRAVNRLLFARGYQDMAMEESRRSDRVWTELPVQISGEDGTGRAFVDEVRTSAVSRHGAMVVIERKLMPNQELILRCLATGRECEARVVGSIRKEQQKSYYGIELLDHEIDLWGIEFPPPGESKGSVGRILLQCVPCKTQEVAYLNDFELEVLEANESLSRRCKRCGDMTTWKKLAAQEAAPAGAKPAAVRKADLRREPRREIRVTACVRCYQFGKDDLVDTRNVSRGGLCFASSRVYAPGWEIDVAVPYSTGGGNIFLSGKIARVQYLQTEKVKLYGVAYTHKKA